jgi:microcystin-dependent protein
MKSETRVKRIDGLHRPTPSGYARHRLSPCFLAAWIVLAGLMLPAGMPCTAQGSDDALYIDEKGNVGIGRQAPQAKLDVGGSIRGIGMVPAGGIVMFYGEIDAAFDEQGAGRAGTPYEGWQLCNGGNGSPDLRGRFILAAGQGPDSTHREMGAQGGEESHTLTTSEIPAHDHQATTTVYPPAIRSEKIYHAWNSSRTYSYGASPTPQTVKTSIAGEGKAHNNMPPFYTLAFIMRLPQR